MKTLSPKNTVEMSEFLAALREPTAGCLPLTCVKIFTQATQIRFRRLRPVGGRGCEGIGPKSQVLLDLIQEDIQKEGVFDLVECGSDCECLPLFFIPLPIQNTVIRSATIFIDKNQKRIKKKDLKTTGCKIPYRITFVPRYFLAVGVCTAKPAENG